MSLSADEVKKIAHLARLAVDDAAVTKYSEDLSNILNLVTQMSAVDTTNITPMAHSMAASQRLREDKVTEPDHRELFQSIAPKVQAGLYLVPQVIETGE